MRSTSHFPQVAVSIPIPPGPRRTHYAAMTDAAP